MKWVSKEEKAFLSEKLEYVPHIFFGVIAFFVTINFLFININILAGFMSLFATILLFGLKAKVREKLIESVLLSWELFLYNSGIYLIGELIGDYKVIKEERKLKKEENRVKAQLDKEYASYPRVQQKVNPNKVKKKRKR